MTNKRYLVLTFGASLIALTACSEYESGEVALHEAGVYMGEKDPLVDKLRSPELEQALNERFTLVQTDR